MGVRPIKLMNQALLGKWHWRLGYRQGLWKSILSYKYDITRNGWDLPVSSPCHSGIWKGILSVKDLFSGHLGFHAGFGDEIQFWHDVWVGHSPLATKFLHLYCCARDKLAKISCYFDIEGGSVVCGPIFKRNLSDVEVELLSLLTCVEGLYVPEDGSDRRVWEATTDGCFLASSFFSVLAHKSSSSPLARLVTLHVE